MKIKAYITIAVITLLTVYSLPHEVSAAQWAKTYGTDGYTSGGSSILQTADGGYLVSGYTLGGTVSGSDHLILKLDSKGDIEWQTTHDRGSKSVESVQVTTDGGYIVAGWGFSSVHLGTDYWIEKLDYSGNIEWQKHYDSNVDYYESQKTSSIQQTKDGGYIVAGWTGHIMAPYSTYSFWLLKLDSKGNIEWQKMYPAGGENYIEIQQTNDGGYIAAGATHDSGAGGYDFWLCKLDSNGNSTWQKTYGGEDTDLFKSIQLTSDGGYIVAGKTRSFGLDSYDAWILKLDSNGNVDWQKNYGGNEGEEANSIRQTSDGGYIVAGETKSFGSGNYDFWVFKLDENGSLSWQKAYGGAEKESTYCIQTTTDGGYIVTGKTESFGAGLTEILVLKIDSNGNIGNCDIVQTTDANVSNTNVTGTIASLTADNTEGIVIDKNITPQKSTVESWVICKVTSSTPSTTTSTTTSISSTTTSYSSSTTTADSTTTSSAPTNGDCAPECPDNWIGDNYCDVECYVSECNYDDGDCWPCPPVLIYGEHSEETELLRDFRDDKLKKTPEGQELIRLYYQWSPVVVEVMKQDEEFKEDVKELIEGILLLIEEEAQ